MSILKYKICPQCGMKAYHRYRNVLRNRFISKCVWECTNCGHATPATTREPVC